MARLLTLANALTALRALAIPAFIGAVGAGRADLAFALFWLAVATDAADGRVARRRGQASSFGGVLDHATDALFVALGLQAYVSAGAVPAPLPALVLLAFLQYALDSRVLAGRALRTSALGRTNGVAYFVLLGVPVVRDALGLGWPPDALVRALGWALVATTLASMLDRALAWLASRRSRGSPGA